MPILIMILALIQLEHAQAEPTNRRCSTIFKVARHGYSLTGQPLKLPPVTEIHFGISGHVRLQEVVRDGLIYSHAPIATRTLEALNDKINAVEFGPRDTLLLLDIQGDKGGRLFHRMIEGLINSQALDITGLEAHSIVYRGTASSLGTQRTVIIIKQNFKDHRELPDGETPVRNRSEALEWLNFEISRLFETLFEPTVFNAMDFPKTAQKVYQLLSQRPGIPEGHQRHRLTQSEFHQAFNIAFQIMLQTMDSADMLYLRSSFWDVKPEADRGAVELFHYSNQRGLVSIDEFTADFSARALELREKLYRHIHQTSIAGGRGRGTNDYNPSDSLMTLGARGMGQDQSPALSGMTPQGRLGLDFFASRGGEYQSVRDATEHSPLWIREIAERLEEAGLVELAQLSFMDASKLEREAPFLTIQEIESLALELAQHRVHMSYPKTFYFRMDPSVRTIVKPPQNRQFYWDPLTNSYAPKSEF